MPINLIDIRNAVQDYLDTKVTVTVSAFRGTKASGRAITNTRGRDAPAKRF